MSSKKIGIWGEKIAENYLIKKGYQILDKNYSTNFNCRAKRGEEESKALFASGPQRGEIDIIAKPRRDVFDILRGKKEDVIHFIEVKTILQRSGGQSSAFSPEDKVNWSKQRKIIRAAEFWLMKKKIPLDSKWQIDVIAIKINTKKNIAKIQHFKNAVF